MLRKELIIDNPPKKSEIFNLSNNLLTGDQKEHVTKFFYSSKKYKIFNYQSKKNYNKYNLSIDNYDDYSIVSKIIKKEGKSGVQFIHRYLAYIVVGIIGLGVGAFHLKNSLGYKNCKVKYICDTNQKKLS